MSGVPILKKKLKGIRATEKLSKAMKTVSMAKIARLNTLRKNYSCYAEQYRFLYAAQTTETPTELPSCVAVLAGNRGFCGAFNADVVHFAAEQLQNTNSKIHLIACGEQAIGRLSAQYRKPDETYVFGDIPSFAACKPFLAALEKRLEESADKRIAVIYPAYKNTMVQTPKTEILSLGDNTAADGLLWIPDRETVLSQLQKKGFETLLYGMILETALGAQAATLMTMRSAYDTATEYAAALEREIGRKRQSEVTADVIETSSERGSKGEETYG